MEYEYRAVPAPERAKKHKGTKSAAERLARTFEDILNEQAEDGWEYIRSDLLPVEEKPGFFSRPQSVQRAMMIFRRAVAAPREQITPSQPLFEPTPQEPSLTSAAVAQRNPAKLPPLPKEYDDLSGDPPTESERLAR